MKRFGREPDRGVFERTLERIRLNVHRTPVVTCRSINESTGTRVYMKCENLQKAGAFKFRGATNAVLKLTENEAKRGVATHSSGNHAQALCLAARSRGIVARIVMPSNAPKVKVEAVLSYGGEITFCDPTLEARESSLKELVDRTGAYFVHPYDNWRIIAGQGTALVEMVEQISCEMDTVLVPIGGGGLTAGTALAARYFSRNTRVVAVEPVGADDAFRSFALGLRLPSSAPETIADGLLTEVGEKNFKVISRHVDEIVTVKEETIIRALKMVWERAKLVVEPSAVVPIAALLERPAGEFGADVGVILSGGNADVKTLSELF